MRRCIRYSSTTGRREARRARVTSPRHREPAGGSLLILCPKSYLPEWICPWSDPTVGEVDDPCGQPDAREPTCHATPNRRTSESHRRICQSTQQAPCLRCAARRWIQPDHLASIAAPRRWRELRGTAGGRCRTEIGCHAGTFDGPGPTVSPRAGEVCPESEEPADGRSGFGGVGRAPRRIAAATAQPADDTRLPTPGKPPRGLTAATDAQPPLRCHSTRRRFATKFTSSAIVALRNSYW